MQWPAGTTQTVRVNLQIFEADGFNIFKYANPFDI